MNLFSQVLYLVQRPLFLVGVYLFLSCPAWASPLKLTTWNLDWLTLRPAGDPALPADVIPRRPEDFALLHQYAMRLKSNIIAFEEVDGPEAAKHVFDPEHYQIIMTNDPVVQRVGIAIRNDLAFTLNPEFTELNVSRPDAAHPLRGGLDITIHDGKNSLRLLVVHLKTGCWARPLNERKHSCPTLYRQFHALEEWILNRQDEGIAYALLGDFNRRLTPQDPLMQNLSADAPLTLTTAGYASPCEGGRRFIDHIILGNAARQWLVPNSLSVMTFHDAPETAQLSDHCPVSIKLNLP